MLSARILDASVVLGVALLVGRLSGIVRELLLAGSFGVSTAADTAILLLTLPDLLVGLLLAGGLSAALVPRFRRLDAPAAATLFRRAVALATGLFSAFAVVLAAAPALLFRIFAPGMVFPASLLVPTTVIFVALALPLTAASGVATAFLNARDRYFVAGLGTLIFNLVVIAALLVGGGPQAMLWNLGLAIALGAAIRLLSQMIVVPQSAWFDRSADGQLDATVARAFLAGVGATGLALLAPILVRAAASLLGPGTIAAFNYAQKLTELPIGILITTISTVALTAFGGLSAAGNEDRLQREVGRRLRLSFLTALAVTSFGIVFITPFIHLLFMRSAMDANDLQRVATLTAISLTSLPFVAISSIGTALLNARSRTGRVLAINGVALALLPALALPGMLLRSEMLLMVAAVGFQVLVAALIARDARLVDSLRSNPRADVALPMLAIVGLAAAATLLASISGLHQVARLAIGGLGLSAALIVARRGWHEKAF